MPNVITNAYITKQNLLDSGSHHPTIVIQSGTGNYWYTVKFTPKSPTGTYSYSWGPRAIPTLHSRGNPGVYPGGTIAKTAYETITSHKPADYAAYELALAFAKTHTLPTR
jgi:hypothetical protein